MFLLLQFWEYLYRRRKRDWYWCGNRLSDYLPCRVHQNKGQVSVVLPVYNQAATVTGAIESVLRQRYPHVELIIVNDGSTDETPAILADYDRCATVTIIHQPNRRLPTALNRGFRAATGEFLTWSSADNLMHPSQLEQLVSYLQQHPDVAVAYADFELIDGNAQPVTSAAACLMRGEAGRPVVRPRREAARLNIGYECVVGPCFLYRSFLPLLIGNYDPRLEGSEDFDYWIRIHNFFKIGHLGSSQPLYRYRLAGDRMSVRLRDRVSTLRRWLMAREQQFQQRLKQPVAVAVDRGSIDKVDQITRRDNRWPRLVWQVIDTAADTVDPSPRAFFLKATRANCELIETIIQTGSRPLVLWFDNQRQPDDFIDLAAQADVVISLNSRYPPNLPNCLIAGSLSDAVELLRIFIGSRLNRAALPPPL